MFQYQFGIEVEFTGITRAEAAEVTSEFLHGDIYSAGGHYGVMEVHAPDGRTWKFMSDGSIDCQRKVNGETIAADKDYSVELVSPILYYDEDIDALQHIVRRLRKAGGFANDSCGIHIHLDGSDHTAGSIRNFVNLVASRNDLFYKALQIKPERMQYCKKMDAYMVRRLNSTKPKTLEQIRQIWYAGYVQNHGYRYHDSRYHLLNLHSFFGHNHTVELRGFNGTLHAGKIRAYIVFALAINHQALTQTFAHYRNVQTDNEKFAMRTYLTRIGLNGPEFKNCRKHLYAHLDGNAAWRFGSKANASYHIDTKHCDEVEERGKDENE